MWSTFDLFTLTHNVFPGCYGKINFYEFWAKIPGKKL